MKWDAPVDFLATLAARDPAWALFLCVLLLALILVVAFALAVELEAATWR